VIYARLLIEHLGWSRGWIDLYQPAEYPGIAERMTDIILNGIAAPGQAWPTDQPAPLGAAAETHRDRFLIAATALINRHGYNGASIDEIAASLNVTKGSFYHHLQDKEELLQACFERTFAITREALNRTAEADSGWQRLYAVATSLILHQAQGVHGPMLRTQTLAAVSVESRPGVMLQYRDLAYRLATILCAGIADGSIRPVDPFLAAQVVIGAINASLDLDHWMRDASAVDILQDFARPALMGLPIGLASSVELP
jgi:AcrR family transcriptional regulator